MTDVIIAGLRKVFPGQQEVIALDNVDLEINEGELVVLLGPSGCGKTTTLRSIAGLEAPTAGRITIGPDVVFDRARGISRPPEKRNIGMVFQSYALWPNKTVRRNIAYPLRARGLKTGLAEGWVESAAGSVDCSDLLDRYPSALSGGQQQRVALARGLVARPAVMLFDEPLSNLDAKLRDQVRGELHDLHRRLNFTGVYVTHDQQEALALGDRLAVMRKGAIEQLATPLDVFERPATDYVADFMGFFNRIDLRQATAGYTSEVGTLGALQPRDGMSDLVTLRSRPEDLRIVPAEFQSDDDVVITDLTVLDRYYSGHTYQLTLGGAAEGPRLRASVSSRDATSRSVQLGATVAVALDPAHCRTYGPAGTAIETSWTLSSIATTNG
jgi:iron(III) transport system ATP-binding protein